MTTTDHIAGEVHLNAQQGLLLQRAGVTTGPLPRRSRFYGVCVCDACGSMLTRAKILWVYDDVGRRIAWVCKASCVGSAKVTRAALKRAGLLDQFDALTTEGER